MAPRRRKKRSRSPSQKFCGDHAEDFDLLPPIERVPFSSPWHGAPKDEFSRTAHLWPIELFEAFYGVLRHHRRLHHRWLTTASHRVRRRPSREGYNAVTVQGTDHASR